MADAVKAQKLAAARKRLKEYQKTQSKQKNVRNTDEETLETAQKAHLASDTVTPADSMTSSTHSCFENATPVQENSYFSLETNEKESNASFFNKALFQQPAAESNHILSNYFDTIPADTCDKDTLPAQTLVESENNQQYADPFEIENTSKIYSVNDNIMTVESVNSQSANDDDGVADGEPATVQTSEDDSHTNVYSDIPLPETSRTQSECALTPQPPATNTNEIITNENQNAFSNTESLRQLSSQLNSLIIDNSEATANICESTTLSSTSELERRNQELAGLLKAEQLKNEQLNLQVREYVTRIAQLDAATRQIRNEHEAKLSLEVGPLQEQLDYHMKAFGILVGERTELQSALTQSQTAVKQKTGECEELHGRLRASRHRVAELEKEVNQLKSFREHADKYDQENNREFERLRLECNLLKEQYEEASEESSELREKLNSKVSEYVVLQNELQDKQSQLSLAQLKLQQLTNGDSVHVESQIEILNQQKISLEQQITELAQTVKTVSLERDQASQQYQQYVQQLNAQIQSLAEKLQTKTNECETLAEREQSLVKHISELERHLQQLQNEKLTAPSVRIDNSTEVRRLEDTINALETEKVEMESRYQEEMQKKQALENDLVEKTERILELESNIERLQDQPDATKLLAAMESDKVAASRAVEQNKKLKEQLEELHDGFIKMSNSKLELTEKLQSEKHLASTLSEKLTEHQTAVEHLHQVIATKDEQLTELHNQTTELQKQILHQNQLTDRLRHYEAQGNTSDYVQQELQQARRTIVKLTDENEQLRVQVEKLTPSTDSLTDQQTDEPAASIANSSQVPPTADETQNEIQLLKDQIDILEKLNAELQAQVNNYDSDNTVKDAISTSEPDKELHIDKEIAMTQLEARFKQTMVDVANLTEEKQRLEHLVLQLQSETETIGEYVALYQCQRALMREKALEKDEQLKRLARDREEMRYKLEQLNALIQRLVVEKGIITRDALLSLHHDSCQRDSGDNRIKTNDTTTTTTTAEEEEDKESVVNGGSHDNNNVDGTAGKIIALLSEIKTSNLVQPGDSIQNFHPCPLCSGQLITV